MTEILTFSDEHWLPGREAVLENQGIPAGRPVSAEIEKLYTTALELLTSAAEPAGVLAEITAADFEIVYRGEGRNEQRTPVGGMLDRVERLALFAVTVGAGVSREIDERFQANDPAVGCMLDSAASLAADNLAARAEQTFRDALAGEGPDSALTGVLRYSPGYCGWHISGQKKLFEYLRPQQIGLSLRESFLMEPLKSVSGVILAGPKQMHNFPASYVFCKHCETHGCRERIRTLLAE